MTDRRPRSPIWIVLGTLLWLGVMLGSMFTWAMYAGVAYRSHDPILNQGLVVILVSYTVAYLMAVGFVLLRGRRS